MLRALVGLTDFFFAISMITVVAGDEKDMTDTEYLVDHSILFLLVNPDGQFVNFFERDMVAYVLFFCSCACLIQSVDTIQSDILQAVKDFNIESTKPQMRVE